MTPTARNRRRNFGATWWGSAWIDALETRSQLDPNRLPRGRTYARGGKVADLTPGAGTVTARVHGSRATPYEVLVRVRPFGASEWEQVLDAITERAAHAAALLDGELTPQIVGDVAAVGIELLPGPGEIGTQCSCPDWANPCKHAAAVCYLVADLLDDDPFVALLLRGRGRQEVVAALRARRSAAVPSTLPSSAAAPSMPRIKAERQGGVVAREAWARAPREMGPLPSAPPRRERPRSPAPFVVDPPVSSGLSGTDLMALAQDAAARAWSLLAGESDGGLDLDVEADLARRAADALGTPAFDALAGAAGQRPRDLLGRAVAWQHGGRCGVAVTDRSWRPPASVLTQARRSLRVAGHLARVRDNRITVVGTPVQIRYGRDGRWYRFERHNGEWELAAPSATGPLDALGQVG